MGRQAYRGISVKPTKISWHRDKKKLQIAYFLRQYERGVSRHFISEKSNLRTQEPNDFKILLEDMVSMQWVTKSQQSTGGSQIDIYSLTDNGKKVIDFVKNLLHDKNPIVELDLFQDLD